VKNVQDKNEENHTKGAVPLLSFLFSSVWPWEQDGGCVYTARARPLTCDMSGYAFMKRCCWNHCFVLFQPAIIKGSARVFEAIPALHCFRLTVALRFAWVLGASGNQSRSGAPAPFTQGSLWPVQICAACGKLRPPIWREQLFNCAFWRHLPRGHLGFYRGF